jgi:acetate kinase
MGLEDSGLGSLNFKRANIDNRILCMNILVLNCGSSTVKFQLIATDLDLIAQNADRRLARGTVERIGGEAIVTLQVEGGEPQRSVGGT